MKLVVLAKPSRVDGIRKGGACSSQRGLPENWQSQKETHQQRHDFAHKRIIPPWDRYPPFYRRSVTGRLQTGEFLMNGPESDVQRTKPGEGSPKIGCANAKTASVQSREEIEYFRGTPVADRSAIAVPAIYLSPAHKQWKAEFAQTARDSVRAPRSFANPQFHLAYRRAARPVQNPPHGSGHAAMMYLLKPVATKAS